MPRLREFTALASTDPRRGVLREELWRCCSLPAKAMVIDPIMLLRPLDPLPTVKVAELDLPTP